MLLRWSFTSHYFIRRQDFGFSRGFDKLPKDNGQLSKLYLILELDGYGCKDSMDTNEEGFGGGGGVSTIYKMKVHISQFYNKLSSDKNSTSID